MRKEIDDRNKRLDDFEKHQQRDKAEELKRQREDMLKYARQAKKVSIILIILNQAKEEEREREKAEYQALCNRLDRRFQNKQDALAEYYRQLENQMNGNVDMHLKQVLSPEQERLNKLRNTEDKNYQDYLRKQAQGDENGQLNRLKHKQLWKEENDKMLKSKQYQQELDRMEQLEEDMKARNERNAFQIGKEVDLEEQKRKQDLYKQTLLYQQAMNQHNKHNFGKMTFAGKTIILSSFYISPIYSILILYRKEVKQA